MPKTIDCPFFTYYTKNRLYCEAGNIRFPSDKAWVEYTDRYCGSVDGWKKCMIAQNLWQDYERNEKKQNA